MQHDNDRQAAGSAPTGTVSLEALQAALARLQQENAALRARLAAREADAAASLRDHVTDALIATDAQFRLTAWNCGAEAMYGFTAEEALGRPVSEIIGSDLGEAEWIGAPEALHEAGRLSTRMVTYHRDGTPLLTDGLTMTLRGQDGAVRGYLCVNRRVDSAEHAPEAPLPLADARSILDHLFAFVGVLAPDGTLLDANRAPLDAAGLTLGDVVGKKFWDCYWWNHDAGQQDRLREAVARAAAGDVVRYDADVRMADDARMPIDFMLAPLRDEHGAITHLIPSGVDITARKQAEEALRAQTEETRRRLAELEATYDTAPVGLCVLDPDLRYRRINRRLAEINGRSVEEHLGRHVREVVPDLLEQAEDALNRVMESGEALHGIEIVGETPAQPGRQRVWIESWYPLRDGEERIIGVNIVAEEVTERREAEAALRESQERLRTFVEAGSSISIVLDAAGMPIYANSLWEDYFGFSFEEAGRRAWVGVIHPDEYDAIIAGWTAALASGTLYECEYRLLRRDGAARWHFARVVPVRDPGGVTAWCGTLTDIHALKETEESLRESEARFRALFSSIDEGYCLCEMILDDDGQAVDYRFLEVNPLFEEMTGLADAGGRTAYELVPNLEPHWVETYARVALGGEPVRFESGSEAMGRWFDVFATPVEPHGRFALVFKDITERREAERALNELNRTLEQQVQARTQALTQANRSLQQRNRELQDFAYVASHDLQEPLRKIQAFAGLLKADFGERLNDDGRFFLERMEDAAARMSALISALLSFSRITTQGRPFERVDLRAVAQTVLGDLSVLCEETGGTVELGAFPIIHADPMQMHQLLQNLIANALKFREAEVPPHVRVYGELVTGEDGLPRCRLVVEDDGIGFDEKYLERIFSPFQRLHGRGRYEGTGMGLAICRRIVERHHGTITAESQPGTGSRFIVELPVRMPGAS